jgi:hypothetical protein
MIYGHSKAHNLADEQRDELMAMAIAVTMMARSETMTNTTMTASSTPAVMAARHLGPAAIFQWPLAWALIYLLLAVDFVWAWQIGLSVAGIELSAGSIIVLLAISVIYRPRSRAIADIAAATASWGALMSTGVVLSYLAASCALPLQDEMMERLDRVVGFDWLPWHDAILGHPALSWLLSIAYYSLHPQGALSVMYFAVSGRTERIRELLLLAGVTLAATVSISAIWPTLGPFAAHGGGDVAYLRDVLALRAGGPWHFKLSEMEGIVTMPSYHTVLAVLFTYAFRRTGLVGYAVATLNVVMLLSIPPIGGHYLVDMLVGGALALGAIAVQPTLRHGVSRILFGLSRLLKI